MEALLPDRYPQRDFFVANILDAAPRDDMASMEHPVFSLSTKKDMRTLTYERNGNRLRIIPSGEGLATVFDKDILIYCTSQLVAAINEGKQPSKTVRLTTYSLIKAINRPIDGQTYKRVHEALIRLKGTIIETNIRTNDQKITRGFGLIDEYEIVEKSPDDERMVAVEVTLSEWLYNAILGREVLPISREYFRLRKPTDRRLYELARKHCGKQPSWSISLELLKTKLGTTAPLKKLRLNVRQIAKSNHLPNYLVSIDDKDCVTFRPRPAMLPAPSSLEAWQPDDDTWQAAREAAPGWDVQALLDEWRTWVSTKKDPPQSFPRSFLGFCKKRGPYQH